MVAELLYGHPLLWPELKAWPLQALSTSRVPRKINYMAQPIPARNLGLSQVLRGSPRMSRGPLSGSSL